MVGFFKEPLLVGVDFLPIGITWAFTIAIIVLSFSGKFGGCTIAARVAGYGWRESSTVGALMSCKGFVTTYSRLLPFAHLR